MYPSTPSRPSSRGSTIANYLRQRIAGLSLLRQCHDVFFSTATAAKSRIKPSCSAAQPHSVVLEGDDEGKTLLATDISCSRADTMLRLRLLPASCDVRLRPARVSSHSERVWTPRRSRPSWLDALLDRLIDIRRRSLARPESLVRRMWPDEPCRSSRSSPGRLRVRRRKLDGCQCRWTNGEHCRQPS